MAILGCHQRRTGESACSWDFLFCALRILPLGLVRVLTLAVVFFPMVAPADAQVTQATEYQLKAAFLFGFAKFVDWPAQTFASPQSPFSVCVIGLDPFGRTLDESIDGKSVGDHSVKVDRFPNARNLTSAIHCQIAFVSASEKQHLREVIDAFRGSNVLLVGDCDGFAASGGDIEFMIEDSRIRLAINLDAADRADLKVSSKLLAIAKIVHDDTERGRN